MIGAKLTTTKYMNQNNILLLKKKWTEKEGLKMHFTPYNLASLE